MWIFSESQSSSEDDNESISFCEETSYPDTSDDDYDEEEEGGFFVLSSTGNRIIDVVNLQEAIVQASKCSKYGISNLCLQETAREGLGSCLSLSCMAEGCGAVTNFHSSRKSRFFHINQLSVLAMRRIGRGYEALRKFTSMTNLPPPVSKTTFFDHQAAVCAAAERSFGTKYGSSCS